MKDFHEDLREKRKELQIGLRQVQDALHVCASNISKWERGLIFLQGFGERYWQYLHDCETGKIHYTKSPSAGFCTRAITKHAPNLDSSQSLIHLPLLENNEDDKRKINHPIHYSGKVEVIDFIDSLNLNFNLGNVFKYIARAGRKDGEDTLTALRKAQWYLNREIKRYEQVQQEVQLAHQKAQPLE